jgi:argininosuccinate lyase
MTLWGGRFSSRLDEAAWKLNTSLPFDRRLGRQDLLAGIAWAGALLQAGVLTDGEYASIDQGLHNILDEIEAGSFAFLESDEDIHSAVERRLAELIGSPALKLNTGRSRNDQVATDFRLWMLETLPVADSAILGMQTVLVDVSEANLSVIMPGYTHLQRAQPVLFSHWLMSFFWMLQRDRERLADLRKRVAVLPLGCAAVAGTSLKDDREALSVALGFDHPAQNSIDAVSDRDFAAEYLFWAAMTGLHLSRLSEAVVQFTSSEFGFLELADAFSTGSSLMPQKKNPDLFELVRGKSGALIGMLAGLLATLKGLPSAYDKDLQEDKLPVFQATDILLGVLPVLAKAIESMTIRRERMLAAIDQNMLATDLADFLTREGVPFREAHAVVGKAIRLAAEGGIDLKTYVEKEWKHIGNFESEVDQLFDPARSVRTHAAIGGTAPEAVEKQIEQARALIKTG